jgi:hypothetical protein
MDVCDPPPQWPPEDYMGKQYNKVIKQRRRKARIKRIKERVKVERQGKKKAKA